MIAPLQPHTHLIGKTCKLTKFGIELEKEYSEQFGIGNPQIVQILFEYGQMVNSDFEIRLMFVDEKPMSNYGLTWFCLKEVGKYSSGDYHWFTLEQLVICSYT